jgi:hypothetical protein
LNRVYAFSKTNKGGVMEKAETLETIWEVPNDLWERVEPIILQN